MTTKKESRISTVTGEVSWPVDLLAGETPSLSKAKTVQCTEKKTEI